MNVAYDSQDLHTCAWCGQFVRPEAPSIVLGNPGWRGVHHGLAPLHPECLEALTSARPSLLYSPPGP